VRLEGLGQLKNPTTSSGIEPVTFWLVDSASTNYAKGLILFSEEPMIISLYSIRQAGLCNRVFFLYYLTTMYQLMIM
jgi:hypothetical protein